jgi:hypothetical protein
MRKIALFALLSLPLLAGFFPKTVYTSVTSVEGKNITLKSAFPIEGMSGVVIHDYGNDLTAITHRITQTSSKSNAKLLDADVLQHDELPTIKTAAIAGDKVVGGYLYENVLLLAPDADTYAKVTSQYPKKTWIHPDLFALYLAVHDDLLVTKGNLTRFAKKFQVGLICIVRKDSVILLDPISGKTIAKKSMKGLPSEGSFPFYMRFGKLDTGWFSSDIKGNYYLSVGRL